MRGLEQRAVVVTVKNVELVEFFLWSKNANFSVSLGRIYLRGRVRTSTDEIGTVGMENGGFALRKQTSIRLQTGLEPLESAMPRSFWYRSDWHWSQAPFTIFSLSKTTILRTLEAQKCS